MTYNFDEDFRKCREIGKLIGAVMETSSRVLKIVVTDGPDTRTYLKIV